MQVIEIQNNGLCQAERPMPSINTGEVLIKVEAAGVNRADLFQVAGKYPPPAGASDIPGLEVAGEIIQTGKDVTGWKIGDKVAALLAGGGYAEYAAAPAVQLLPIPSGLSAIEAASLPEACFTVWLNLFNKAKLQSGDTILIHAGASGIGTLAIQCAKAFGITVLVTAGNKEKCEACEALGAKRAINYHKEDFVHVVQEETEGRGVTLVLDIVGGEYIQRNLKCLGLNGTMISLAFLQGATATVNFAPLLMKNLTLMGSTLRSQSLEHKATLRDAIYANLWPKVETGVIVPVIDRVLPLKEATAAHHIMQSNQNIGKIVLQFPT